MRGDMQWICDSSGLSISKDAQGMEVQEVIALDPKESSLFQASPSGGSVTADDGDWCSDETCHVVRDFYRAETVGNAVYGNQNGVIGTYQVVMRSNLNGRSGQWTVSLYIESGPSLSFTDVRVQCNEIEFIPLICGDHDLPDATLTLGTASFKKNFNTIYGNYLANDGQYTAKFLTKFTPAGYSTYTAGPLTMSPFTCHPKAINCNY